MLRKCDLNLRKCPSCSGKFRTSFFKHVSLICSHCRFRCKLEGFLKESRAREVSLTRRIKNLEEIVNSNSGQQELPDSQIQPCGGDELNSTAESSCEVSENSSETPPENNIVLPPQEADFQIVMNGAHPKKKTVLPVTTYNKFSILAGDTDDDEETQETRLVGDSIIRGQLLEFCGRVPNHRKRFCIPGAGLDDVAAASEVTDGATSNTLFLVHTGTNDVLRTRSEALLEKYKRLIEHFKTSSNNIILSGVLPRISANNTFYSKAFSLNNRLKSLCFQEGIEFINTWDHFYRQPDLFADDGLHLNSVGSARFGRLLDDAVRSFRSKNLTCVGPSEVP